MKLGVQAEDVAARYLQQRGLKLVCRNYRSCFGEIDLILRDGDVLVFVEVRMRSSQQFGGAAVSIDLRKQTKIIRTAQYYLATLSHIPACRFDAVLIAAQIPNAVQAQDSLFAFQNANIEWLKNAFEA